MFKVGDRIAYTAKFLRSIGDYSYESASLRGTVLNIGSKLTKGYVLEVQWDRYSTPSMVLDQCLILKDRLHLEPA
jgi:hypothetical protein